MQALPSYRSFIRDEMTRKKAEARLSLRQLAAAAGVSASYLSQVMNGKRQLSENVAYGLAEGLRLSKEKRAKLIALVRFERTKSAQARAELGKTLKDMAAPAARLIEREENLIVSRWYYGAILELLDLKNSELTPRFIARRLKITQLDAELAVERLLRAGYLARVAGKLTRSTPHVLVRDFPSAVLRNLHADFLQKALQGMAGMPYDECDFTGTTLAIAKAQVPELKQLIREFRRAVLQLPPPESGDSVYHMAVSLFRLDRDDPQETPAS